MGRQSAFTEHADLFATCLPGLGVVLAEEVRELPTANNVRVAGNDGRSDIVRFSMSSPRNVTQLRCAEDLYAVVAEVERPRDLRQLAHRLINPQHIERALAVYGQANGRLLPRETSARIIARVTDERNFRRTDLRYAASKELTAVKPQWRYGDPAQAELWLSQTAARSFISGLRLTTKEFRQRGGRSSERQGALRPSVAAALVRLAGKAQKAGNSPMLDPCCGSGTICLEAAAAGWPIIGGDVDEQAIAVAVANARPLPFFVGDARCLPFVDSSIGAVVSNLPFGRQFAIQGNARQWFEDVLRELWRVHMPGAPIVVLVPKSRDFSIACAVTGFKVQRCLEIDLLGTQTAIWCLA